MLYICCIYVEKDRAKDRVLGYATGKGQGGDATPEARTEEEQDVK